MSAVELVRATTADGDPCWRARDSYGTIAGAIYADGCWLVAGYLSGAPSSPLRAANEDAAREWVRWIAEQTLAERGRVVTGS